MKEGQIKVSESNAFNAKVKKTIDEIYTQLKTDQNISNAQKNFIELSRIPILAMLIDDAHLNLRPESKLYADNIAADLLHAYLSNHLTLLTQAMANLSDVNPKDVEHTYQAIDSARAYLQTIRERAQDKLNQHLALTERLKNKRRLLDASASEATKANLAFGH